MNNALRLGWAIAIWTHNLARSKKKVIEDRLSNLLATDGDSYPKDKFTPRMDRTIETVSDLIHSQRKSLQRITDERAETQDQLIQERLVQERQRLSRELHDSVSQQLFAASMLLSAVTENNANAESKKPFLQIERMVQKAQLKLMDLLIHLRSAAQKKK